jgi:predicted peroxiredoxin
VADDKTLIMVTCGPETPRRCATPFFMATLAATMESRVTMVFSVDGALLLKKGVAESIRTRPDDRPVSEYLADAREAGVRFCTCSNATELHDLKPDDLLEGVEMIGGVTILQLAAEAGTVLSY